MILVALKYPYSHYSYSETLVNISSLCFLVYEKQGHFWTRAIHGWKEEGFSWVEWELWCAVGRPFQVQRWMVTALEEPLCNRRSITLSSWRCYWCWPACLSQGSSAYSLTS